MQTTKGLNMQNMKLLVKKYLPNSLVKFIRMLFTSNKSQFGKYYAITLTKKDIEQGTYKQYFGGGLIVGNPEGLFNFISSRNGYA